jgi:hypothetical protein
VVLDIANARGIDICCRGSFSRRSGSSGGDPSVKLPGGKTIISGQFRHSLNVCPGRNVLSAAFSVWPYAN